MNKKLILFVILPIVTCLVLIGTSYLIFSNEKDAFSYLVMDYWKLERIVGYFNEDIVYDKVYNDYEVLYFDSDVVYTKIKLDEIISKKFYYYIDDSHLCWSDDYKNVNSFDKMKLYQERCYEYKITGDLLSLIDRSNITEVYVYKRITKEEYKQNNKEGE